ncbi:DNA helicase [Tanacetum coccineum]
MTPSVGDGKVGEPDEEDGENESWINLPPRYCMSDDYNGLLELIDFIYDKSTLQTPSATTLQQKAINLNLAGGLCNGTRMIVTQLMSKFIEVQIITRTRVGEKIKSTMQEVTIALNPTSHDKILEAKVYRKWISKSVLKLTLIGFCCILFDREGSAIQAHMNLNDTDYFNQKLRVGST